MARALIARATGTIPLLKYVSRLASAIRDAESRSLSQVADFIFVFPAKQLTHLEHENARVARCIIGVSIVSVLYRPG
jgi:hypothetical protein